MRIAVCDDEQAIRAAIVERIQRLYPSFEVQEYPDGESLLGSAQDFQIAFLDIRMEGLSGMETARRIRRKNPQALLVFLTAWEEYVFQAFDVGAFHYLLKPLNKEKFYQVLESAVQKACEIGGLQSHNPKKSIVLKLGAVTRKIYRDDIVYAEAQNRKVMLHTTSENLEFYARLSDLERDLGNDFARPHRSYLVNLRYVLKYCATDITLEDGTTILLAKQRYQGFVKKYLQYMKRL